jgi:glutathione S-transferase
MTNNYDLYFVGMKVSPPSFKARWALLYNGFTEFAYAEYKPMASEYWLRWKTGNYRGKITVPVLFATDKSNNTSTILTDSLDIAQYADSNKQNDTATIFPDNLIDDIKKWNKVADKLSTYSRNNSLVRMTEFPDALTEQLPGFMHTIGLANFMGKQGHSYFINKYQSCSDAAENVQKMRELLQQVREQLATGTGQYLLDNQFTYADMTIIAALQGVEPIAEEIVTLSPGFRKCLYEKELAEEFTDLLQWRDSVIEKHFPVELYNKSFQN